MRKGIADSHAGTVPFNQHTMSELESNGYKYFQVRGLTADSHYDYIEPRLMVLVPIKELPSDPNLKDIYEPIDSKLLKQWATDESDRLEIVIKSMGH